MRHFMVILLAVLCLGPSVAHAGSRRVPKSTATFVKYFNAAAAYEAAATRAMRRVDLRPGHGSVTLPAVWEARSDLDAALHTLKALFLKSSVSPYDDVGGRAPNTLLNEYVDVAANFIGNYPGPQANAAYRKFFRDHRQMVEIEADLRRHGL